MCCGDEIGPWIRYEDEEYIGFICEDCERRFKIGGFINETANIRNKRHAGRISRTDSRRER